MSQVTYAVVLIIQGYDSIIDTEHELDDLSIDIHHKFAEISEENGRGNGPIVINAYNNNM